MSAISFENNVALRQIRIFNPENKKSALKTFWNYLIRASADQSPAVKAKFWDFVIFGTLYSVCRIVLNWRFQLVSWIMVKVMRLCRKLGVQVVNILYSTLWVIYKMDPLPTLTATQNSLMDSCIDYLPVKPALIVRLTCVAVDLIKRHAVFSFIRGSAFVPLKPI